MGDISIKEELIKQVLLKSKLFQDYLRYGCIVRKDEHNPQDTYITLLDSDVVVNTIVNKFIDKEYDFATIYNTVNDDGRFEYTTLISEKQGIDVTVEFKRDFGFRLPYVLMSEIHNGKIVSKTIGTNPKTGKEYKQEEIKEIISKQEKIEKQPGLFSSKHKRMNKYTILSIICDTSEESIKSNKTHILLPRDKGQLEEILEQKTNISHNSEDILLALYSDTIHGENMGHVVALLVDKEKFHSEINDEKQNSIMCFDSSHFFVGSINNAIDFCNKIFGSKHINSQDLLSKYNIKTPINKKAPQLSDLNNNCSFYVEAFLKMVDYFINYKDNIEKQHNNNYKISLNEIEKFINTDGVIEILRKLQQTYFGQYNGDNSCNSELIEQLCKKAVDLYELSINLQRSAVKSSTSIIKGELQPSGQQNQILSTTSSEQDLTSSSSFTNSTTTTHTSTSITRTSQQSAPQVELQNIPPVQAQLQKNGQPSSETPQLTKEIQNILGPTFTSSEITSVENHHSSTSFQALRTPSSSISSQPPSIDSIN